VDDKILIIANGPSILKQNFGLEIDKFKEIARINNYSIDGFEKKVGTKTTIWLNGGNQNLKKRKDIPKKTYVFIPYEILEKKEHKIRSTLPQKLNIENKNFEILSKKQMKFYQQKSKIKRPTTGLHSILWALDNFSEVYIHGFDFFLNGKEHYFDSSFVKKISNLGIFGKGKKHDNISEKKFVNSLIESNKIILLTDYLKGK
tara:strand:+ start:9636 stop:10241 length:606 start_codon:yes stop_codon:yes gene_type:complete